MRPTTFKSAHAALFLVVALAASGVPSRGLAQQVPAAAPPHAVPRPPHVSQPSPHTKKVHVGHAGTRRKQAATVAVAAEQPAKPETEQASKPEAETLARPQAATAPVPPQQPAPEAAPIPPEVMQFCTNNVAAAGQARVAWEAAKLKDLEAKLRQRIAELEAKRAEYEEWLRKRDEALKKAEETIVVIYSKMRPEAAAQQLAAMDDDMAAAVLTKLKPGNASAILNEMDPGRAARLTAAMVGANQATDGKKS